MRSWILGSLTHSIWCVVLSCIHHNRQKRTSWSRGELRESKRSQKKRNVYIYRCVSYKFVAMILQPLCVIDLIVLSYIQVECVWMRKLQMIFLNSNTNRCEKQQCVAQQWLNRKHHCKATVIESHCTHIYKNEFRYDYFRREATTICMQWVLVFVASNLAVDLSRRKIMTNHASNHVCGGVWLCTHAQQPIGDVEKRGVIDNNSKGNKHAALPSSRCLPSWSGKRSFSEPGVSLVGSCSEH